MKHQRLNAGTRQPYHQSVGVRIVNAEGKLYTARTSDHSADEFIPALPEPYFNCLMSSSHFLSMNEYVIEHAVSIRTACDAKCLQR